MQTKNCIRCFKPAEMWTGHVLKDGEMIIAGWCEKCFEEEDGFFGHYTDKMGLEGDESPSMA